MINKLYALLLRRKNIFFNFSDFWLKVFTLFFLIVRCKNKENPTAQCLTQCLNCHFALFKMKCLCAGCFFLWWLNNVPSFSRHWNHQLWANIFDRTYTSFWTRNFGYQLQVILPVRLESTAQFTPVLRGACLAKWAIHYLLSIGNWYSIFFSVSNW